MEEILTQHDQESRTVSLFLYDPDSPSSFALPTFLIKLLLLRVQESLGMPRNTRENMSIPGNVFDRQHARRDPEELHNVSRNLAISLAILRTEGIEKSGSEEPLQSILLPCFSRKARGSSLVKVEIRNLQSLLVCPIIL